MELTDKYIVLEHGIEGFCGTLLANIESDVDELLPLLFGFMSIYAMKYQLAPILQRSQVITEYKNVTASAISVTYNRIQSRIEESGASLVGVLPTIFEGFALKFKGVPEFQSGKIVLEGKNLTEWVSGLGESLKSRMADRLKTSSDISLESAREAIKAGLPGLEAISSSSVRFDRQAFELAMLDNPTRLTFVAILDNRTSRICRSLHGKSFLSTDPNLPVPPLHPRCRSRLIQTSSSPTPKSYREWLVRMQEARRVDFLKAVLGPRYDLFVSGKYSPDGMEMATKLATAQDVADFVKEHTE